MNARSAGGNDTDEIVRLAADMFAGFGHGDPSTDWHEAARKAVARRLGEDLVVFVVDDPTQSGRLAALAAGMIVERLPAPHNLSGHVGHVQWVATDPTQRRRGLAREAMVALLAWFDAADVPVAELHTSPDAHRLYTSLGFTEVPHPSLRRRPER